VSHPSQHILNAYDNTPGYGYALRVLIPPKEGLDPSPILLVVLLTVGCVEDKVIPTAPPIRMSPQHQHDMAIGVALHSCVNGLTNPRIQGSYEGVWREIQVGRDFSGVSAACVPSAALLSCQARLEWEGVDQYFQTNPGETCVTVTRRVDQVRGRKDL